MKIRYKFALWATGSLLALAVMVGLLGLVFSQKFYPDAPNADYPPAQDLATAQRQDLDFFQHYFTLNKAYSPAALSQAKALHVQTLAKAGTYSPAAFTLAIARMVALSDNGHSGVSKRYLSTTNNRIPCRLYRFEDGYYVIRARPSCAEFLGAKLLGIDGTPVEAITDHMYAYMRGPRNHYDQFIAQLFMESPALLHAAGMATGSDQLNLHMQMRDGTERDVAMTADAPDANSPRVYSDAYLSPERIEDEGDDWTTLLPRDAEIPLFLHEYDKPFHTAWWPEQHTLYVQFRSNMDEEGYPIGAFTKRVEQEVIANNPRFIVLDLRLNQGGDFTKTASLMKRLATLSGSTKHIYVLTSAWTFSAGNVSLALVKEHGGDKVTVIGEAAGDRVRIWAEGGSFELPNSKIRVGYSTGYHDYTTPCWGERGCFWVTLFFPMHVASFEPDAPVAYTFDDYINLRDPMLEKALALSNASVPTVSQ